MNLEATTIELEKTAARDALRQYRAEVKAAAERSRTDADRELAEIDAAIMRGYRELARGNRLLKLSETISEGGTRAIEVVGSRWTDPGNARVEGTVLAPALAICRADARQCWTRPLKPREGGGFTFQADGWQWHPRKADRVEIPEGVFDAALEYGACSLDEPEFALTDTRLRAIVPTIPPALRPAHALRNYHVLWEAEWAQGAAIAPGDPALLKHVGGDLWALLAVWDLSPLERAVLAGVRGDR